MRRFGKLSSNTYILDILNFIKGYLFTGLYDKNKVLLHICMHSYMYVVTKTFYKSHNLSFIKKNISEWYPDLLSFIFFILPIFINPGLILHFKLEQLPYNFHCKLTIWLVIVENKKQFMSKLSPCRSRQISMKSPTYTNSFLYTSLQMLNAYHIVYSIIHVLYNSSPPQYTCSYNSC